MGERTALIRAREMRGMTREDLAAAMGGSRNYVFYIEAGLRDPSFYYMRKWVKALGLGASMELFWTEEPARPAKNRLRRGEQGRPRPKAKPVKPTVDAAE